MKNIVLIDHELFTKRRKTIFMIDKLLNSGYNVEVWDISQIVYPERFYPDEQKENYVRKINSLFDLRHLIKGIDVSNVVFIVECFYNWENRKIFKTLSENNCYIIKLDLYANTTLKESFFDKLSRIRSEKILEFFQKRIKVIGLKIYKKIFNLKNFDRIISSSDIVYRTDKINHPDYESYINELGAKPLVSGNYIVFCDIFFPVHPELLPLFKKQPKQSEYINTLNNFFSFLEEKYKMPVVIAAHPKSDYSGNEFEGRSIIKYSTANLVINSNMVLQHFSNSVSYCVLADKPILFFITKDMLELKQSIKYMELLSKTLGKKIINIDDSISRDLDISRISQSKRVKYIYSYLTSTETENRFNFDIFNSILSNI